MTSHIRFYSSNSAVAKKEKQLMRKKKKKKRNPAECSLKKKEKNPPYIMQKESKCRYMLTVPGETSGCCEKEKRLN
jgi:hypothetical protein